MSAHFTAVFSVSVYQKQPLHVQAAPELQLLQEDGARAASPPRRLAVTSVRAFPEEALGHRTLREDALLLQSAPVLMRGTDGNLFGRIL